MIGQESSVLGIDIDIREYNRVEIEKHPLHKRICMIQGSSIDDVVAKKVSETARNKRRITDKDIERMLLITVAPDGYLKCIKD